ncbi:homocysteine S-methyltransferase family protein [Marinomonas posidonica]|uniref:homocysteine S-methyltransferase family protein n=1 Tax=Marinomonas posidonica TaxID=936476 RepID=UPI003735DFF7
MTDITILDGGMGRELARLGAPFKQPEWSALALMEAPEIVKAIHQSFIDSGSQVITTNSYSLVPFHIGEDVFKQRVRELTHLSGKLARDAADEADNKVQVAASVAPLFGSYRADLYQADRVTEIATPIIEELAPFADLWLLETQCLIDESSRVIALIEQIDTAQKPIWVSFTLEDSEQTEEPLLRSGETVVDAVKAMQKLGVDAILFNCSQPEIIGEAIELTQRLLNELGANNIEIGAYANAFPPTPKDATANDGLDELREDLTPPAYLTWVQQWQNKGASLIGGCCGIGPEHILAIKEYTQNHKY